MKKNLYLFSDSLLKRKDCTLSVERICRDESEENNYEQEDKLLNEEYLLGEDVLLPAGDKKYIPVESIESIFGFGTLCFNSRLLYFLSLNQIPMHIFNFNGNYSGSFLPETESTSGTTVIKQVTFFKHPLKRMEIAKEFVNGAISNALVNLRYYCNRGSQVKDQIQQLEEINGYVPRADSVDELMGFEGTAKKIYYSAWKYIFSYPVEFDKRVKNPPDNLINALISYGNMIVYSICLNEIYHTRLYPEISYLHQPGENRKSLAFDIAEIFKPIITDRVIFKVINKNIIAEKDAIQKNRRCFLNKKAKQEYVSHLEEKLMTKIQVDGKEVRYSYRRLIREECYKLLKHLNEEEKYKAYITKW
jgi:CRISPR-associated protein Cas1